MGHVLMCRPLQLEAMEVRRVMVQVGSLLGLCCFVGISPEGLQAEEQPDADICLRA